MAILVVVDVKAALHCGRPCCDHSPVFLGSVIVVENLRKGGAGERK